jgi:hypothetical protein
VWSFQFVSAECMCLRVYRIAASFKYPFHGRNINYAKLFDCVMFASEGKSRSQAGMRTGLNPTRSMTVSPLSRGVLVYAAAKFVQHRARRKRYFLWLAVQ